MSGNVETTDEEVAPVTIEAIGFAACAFQHELDHLDGVLYVYRLIDITKLFFRNEFFRYGRGGEDMGEGD